MTRKRPGLPAILEHLKQGPERSSLFWWLHEHHDELMAASAGRRIRWEQIAERLADLGLSDRTGKAASAASARQTWLRVRKLVARETEPRGSAGSKLAGVIPPAQPSRLPTTWRPVEVDLNAAPPRLPRRISIDDETDEQRSRRGQASILRLKKTLAQRSGRNPDDVT